MSHRNVVDPILTYLGLVFVNSECYQCMDKCQLGGDANDINACLRWQWDRLCNTCPLVLFDTKQCIFLSFTFYYASTVCLIKLHFFYLPGKLCTCNLGLEAGNRVKIFIRQPSGSEQNWNNNKKPKQMKSDEKVKNIHLKCKWHKLCWNKLMILTFAHVLRLKIPQCVFLWFTKGNSRSNWF